MHSNIPGLWGKFTKFSEISILYRIKEIYGIFLQNVTAIFGDYETFDQDFYAFT